MLYGIAPHDAALDRLSDHDLDVWIQARFEFGNVMSGKPRRPTSLSEQVASMNERYARIRAHLAKDAEQVPTTPKELGWED